MKNIEQAKAYIFINLGGEDRRISYSMRSVAQVLDLSGKNLMKGQIDANDPNDLAILLWGGLIDYDESLDGDIVTIATPETRGKGDENVTRAIKMIQKWMTFDRMPEIAEKVRQALEVSTTAAKKK